VPVLADISGGHLSYAQLTFQVRATPPHTDPWLILSNLTILQGAFVLDHGSMSPSTKAPEQELKENEDESESSTMAKSRSSEQLAFSSDENWNGNQIRAPQPVFKRLLFRGLLCLVPKKVLRTPFSTSKQQVQTVGRWN